MSEPDQTDEIGRDNDHDSALRDERLRAMQSKLIQSQKMAALGALSAGIAHELNNPIGFIKNNVASLHEYLAVLLPVISTCLDHAGTEQDSTLHQRIEAVAAGEDLAFMIEDIEPLLSDAIEGSKRLAHIVDGLKRFAREDDADGQMFDLNQCVEDTLKTVWNELKYKTRVHRQLGELPLLYGRPGEINQVIMNLLVNAAQAIQTTGDITVETAHSDTDVMLRISDDGEGIPDRFLDKIYTPFFTTKATGQSTGLGLTVSQDIIHNHAGRIAVESKTDVGTTFTITLPRIEKQTWEN